MSNTEQQPSLHREFSPAERHVIPGPEARPAHEITAAARGELDEVYLSNAASPYHGILHPHEVWQRVQEIVARVEQGGIDVDEVALERATLLHDALGHLNPKVFGFQSAEELAAHFTYNFLIAQGCPEEEARKAERIVLATNPHYEPQTIEEKIIRAADLHGLGASYAEFRSGTDKLHREAAIRSGVVLPLNEFIDRQFGYLKLFVWPMLELTPDARDERGGSSWHTRTIANLARIAAEVQPKSEREFRVVAEVFNQATEATEPASSSAEKVFYIALANDDEVRERVLGGLIQSHSTDTLSFAIPGHEGGLSLPDQFCDEVRLPRPTTDGLKEASRVLRSGGILEVTLPRPELAEHWLSLGEQYALEPLSEPDSSMETIRFKKP